MSLQKSNTSVKRELPVADRETAVRTMTSPLPQGQPRSPGWSQADHPRSRFPLHQLVFTGYRAIGGSAVRMGPSGDRQWSAI